MTENMPKLIARVMSGPIAARTSKSFGPTKNLSGSPDAPASTAQATSSRRVAARRPPERRHGQRLRSVRDGGTKREHVRRGLEMKLLRRGQPAAVAIFELEIDGRRVGRTDWSAARLVERRVERRVDRVGR